MNVNNDPCFEDKSSSLTLKNRPVHFFESSCIFRVTAQSSKYIHIDVRECKIEKYQLCEMWMGRRKECYRLDGQYSLFRHNHSSIIAIYCMRLPGLQRKLAVCKQKEGGEG